jgi:Rho-binding antiterminator
MTPPYQPVPRFYLERITIAALCNEFMDLHWHDPVSDMNYMERIWPLEVIIEEAAEYLQAQNKAGSDP